LFLIGAPLVYRVMHTDPLVRQVGTEPFRILALFQPLLIVSIVYIHSLRGAGDTRFPLLITIVGVIVVRLPLGALFGLYLGGGLLGAWVGMMGDMTWRAAAALIRFVYGRWDELRI
jgi:Na+-driven multidrug efflux pump